MASENIFQDVQWQRSLVSSLAQDIEPPAAQSEPLPSETFSSDFQVLREAASDIAQGMNNEERWCARLLVLMDLAHERMKTANSPFALATSRAIYVDSCILRGLAQSILFDCLAAVATFDHAIIIAGASGKQYDLIMFIIHKIQSSLPKAAVFNTGLSYDTRDMHSTPDTSQDTIPCLNPPSFSAFQSSYSQAPFILRNYARNWPALNDHPWKSALYLRSVAGPGRVVPVEIGHDYRLADWKQDLVSWDDFISTLDFEDQPSSRTNENLLYMAQHDLTSQFPALRKDIIVPDYVYASLSSKNFPTYSPPNNADQIIINAWLGPKGTMSPAHIDPYYNCYVQVVGFKSVWLAPPSMSSSMYPFGNLSNDETTNRLPSSDLNNTSKVDVFADPVHLNDYPDFVLRTIPNAMTATLGPGDMLFFPPGWWHAMKSNSTSFSISIWF